MQLVIKDFRENLVEFKTHRILNAKTLWVNSQQLSALDDQDWSLERFAQEHAYAIKANELFEDIAFDDSEEKIVTAERYGGQGVGSNGGGARCGNHTHFQVKGIGKNPLASSATDYWHSYGGLNLVDAIYESINAAVLSRILPIGVASIYGIIITGKNTALLPGDPDEDIQEKRSYGALLVREVCVRPAHFFRSAFFNPEKNGSLYLLSDVARVRNANQTLASKFGSTKAFIGQIGKYLANYANQFAFARAARICHGSISPSNMCLDGRWLDLTNTSFLDGGRNVCGSVPFYTEPDAVLDMLEEFIYTYSKYNKLSLNPKALLNYYVEQFNGYFKMHISYVVGIPYNKINGGIANPDWRCVSNVFFAVISSAKDLTVGRVIEYRDSDPVICLIECLYISLVSSEASAKKLINSLGNDAALAEISGAFLRVMQGVYENAKNTKISYKRFILLSAIISIKRSLIPEYFYMGRLENHIYEIVKNKKEEMFSSVIEDSIAIANWAFDLNEGLDIFSDSSSILMEDIIIFRSENICIWLDPNSGLYGLSVAECSDIQYFEKFDGVLLNIKEKKYCTVISQYCFLKYLQRLSETIRIIEVI